MAWRKRAKRPLKEAYSLGAEAVEGNDDLLTKILLLLPPKSLFAFKLVSKRWLSLIADPSFTSLWSPKPSSSALILELSLLEDLYYIPLKGKEKFKISGKFLDFVKDKFEIGFSKIWNSCGGLILCGYARMYHVCNPTIKQFTTLPSPNMVPYDMSLAFDHSISPHYKVISVGMYLHIEIYSSETNSWRQSGVLFPKPCKKLIHYAGGVFFNGAIFWTFSRLDSFCYFDIEREIIHTYPMPKMKREYYCGCIHDHLYLLGTSLGEWHQLDIFELGKDYSSWSLKYRIDLREQMTIPRKFSVVNITMLFVMEREKNQKPHLGIYLPRCQVKLISLKDSTCSKLRLLPLHPVEKIPSWRSIRKVHHLIEYPFLVGRN